MNRFRLQRDPGRQVERQSEVGVGLKLHDRRRGHRRQIMRVQHPEQSIGQLGKFVIQPVVYPGGEKRDPFQQASDMRVVHHIGREAKPAGDLRMCRGELTSQPAQRI